MTFLPRAQHIFPAPRYMTLPNAGVDISDSSVKYMRFERRRAHDRSVNIKNWGSVSVPSGVVVSGEVVDVPKLAQVLSEVKERIETPYVRLSLPEERAYLFETEIKAGTPLKEVRGLLEFKLEENVPIPSREAFFDYDLVEHDDKVSRIVVTVYGREVILKYQEACQIAGLVPLSFEVEAGALARAAVHTDLRGTYMVLDFGQTRTGIGIVHQGSLMYTSTVDLGGNQLSAAFRTHKGNISEDEITSIKNSVGIQHVGGDAALHADLLKAIDMLKEEVYARIQYWNTRDVERGKRDIEQIVLCGGSSNLAGLSEYLQSSFNTDVVHAQVWQNAFSLERMVPPISKRYSYSYATAIGLALTDFVQ